MDYRNEGIARIILKILNVGGEVFPDQLPKFLDDESKEFLI